MKSHSNKSPTSMDTHHELTMAYAACTSWEEFDKLDKLKKGSDSKVRLAKMEQLQINDAMIHIQNELNKANQEVTKAIQKYIESCD